MRSMLRQFRRAPGRILASVFALALAVGAIGVLAIPTISEGTLHEAAARDGLADIVVDTTPLSEAQLAAIDDLDSVVAAEPESNIAIELGDGALTRMIGLQFPDHTMDRLDLVAGVLPGEPDQVVTSPSIGAIGDTIVADGRRFDVVGHGSTLWWSDSDVVYAPLATVVDLSGRAGSDRLVVTAVDDDEASLRAVSQEIRAVLERDGDTFTTFPELLPDGSTPIDADIEQISTLIGLLGVFAGAVALVLLASTTSTLITERTREVAVMRALGGRDRQLRRRLRRIALTITGVALAIGLPLGVAISNLIARMVLEEFVGITPDIAVNWTVLGLSVVGMLLGARLVAARSARKVVGLSLVDALRDRNGSPFGRRWFHRVVARLPIGGLAGRLALRASAHRPGRTLAVVVQVAAAVGAAFLIPSLATSVNEFNTATSASWSWESVTVARDVGLPFDADQVAAADGAEPGVWIDGEVADWEVNVYGLTDDHRYFDPVVDDGRTWAPGRREAVLSAGFAAHNDLRVGDTLTVELAGGPQQYDLVGLADDSDRSVYLDRSVLAADLGVPGGANAVWSDVESPDLGLDVATRTITASEIAADDAAGRDAIVLIFGAIGAIVVGVAALAVLSSMIVSLYERRHELAAMQAIGARRRTLFLLVLRELAPIGAVGLAAGLTLGALGTRGIIASFEASNVIDIGVVDAVGAIPAIVIGTAGALVVLSLLIVRAATRRPIAVTLRGAA